MYFDGCQIDYKFQKIKLKIFNIYMMDMLKIVLNFIKNLKKIR